MRRISVAQTIRDAYSFAATHLGGIIGLIWVSMVMITIARYFTFYRFYNDFIDFMASGNGAQMGPSLLMMIGYLVAMLLLYAVMFTAVVQLALGARSAPAVIHFAFGPLEWRMFRAFLALASLMLLMALTVLIAANALLLVPGGGKAQGAVGGLAILAVMGISVAVLARFLVLLPAIAVSETAPALRRAWALSAGNFLPMVGVLLGLFVPLLVLLVLIDFGMGEKAEALPGAATQVQMVAAVMHARQTLPLTCGLGFLFSPLVIGLLAGASVSAWRTLKDEPSVEILA
ncbi:MAG: hypothetical protein H0U98_04610 [Alphaproteobacteria bacterium]|nr:hypothetical protein [Alphaproteobacteria bacterium]